MIPPYPVGQYDRNLSIDLNRVTPVHQAGPVPYITLTDSSKNVGNILPFIFQLTFVWQIRVYALFSACRFSYVCLLFELLKQFTLFANVCH